jgi:L-asparagine oxygenase
MATIINDYDFRFTPEEVERYKRVLLDVGGNPYTDYAAYWTGVAQAAELVPNRFQDFCYQSVLRDFSEHPFVVIGNAPIDDDLPVFDPVDPVADKYRTKRTFVAEGFLATYAVLTGTELVAHLTVNDGDFFHDIYPKRSMQDTQSQKTLGTLKFHRDFTNHFACPDFVNTLTLRDTPENEVYSTFAVTKHVLRTVSAADKAVLAQPRFHTPFDDVSKSSSRLELGRAKDHPVILDGQSGVKVFEGRTVGLDEEAAGVLKRFIQALHGNKVMRISVPGDSVTFSNHHVIHGREVHEIRDPESLERRWLLKTHNVYSLGSFEEYFLDDRYGVVNG